MDVRIDSMWHESTPTLADLCEAIAEGRIIYKERYGYVELSALEVRRLARTDRILRRGIVPPTTGPGNGRSHTRGLA
jgi:hypothetical protein